MQNETRRNRPSRSGRNDRQSGTASKNTPGEASEQHTAQERERMQTGLRILAGIIARAHLRRQESGPASAPPPDRRAGG